jgi:DNA-binding beta-propeller fold protein YncE
VYVGSSREDRIQTLTIGRPVNGSAPFLLEGGYFFLDGVGGNTGSSADTRALGFSPTGERLYAINREPPSLQVFDTSSSSNAPANRFTAAFDICRVASRLAVIGERVYVTCFQDGQVYVTDPISGRSDVIDVGRGAFDITHARSRGRAYVTNFLEDTIAVLDVAEASPLRDRVVLRIGTAK